MSYSHDDKGNVMVFEYKPEDSSNVDTGAVSERHRNDSGRTAARYLTRILYGNAVPYYPADGGDLPSQWHFELALDYGDRDGVWPAREDPFSTYRSGFEIRTYGLCLRALMYHRFRELGDGPLLVASTEFSYEPRGGHTFLTRVTRRGHDSDETVELPPLTLAYRPSEVDEALRDVPPPRCRPCGCRPSSSASPILPGTGCRIWWRTTKAARDGMSAYGVMGTRRPCRLWTVVRVRRFRG